jgi:hypothetical protein
LIGLSPDEFAFLSSEIENSTISLHFEWYESSILASVPTNKLVFSAMTRRASVLKRVIRVEQSGLPSEVIHVPLSADPGLQTDEIAAMWNASFFRKPDTIVLGNAANKQIVLDKAMLSDSPIRVVIQGLDVLGQYSPQDLKKSGSLTAFTIMPH